MKDNCVVPVAWLRLPKLSCDLNAAAFRKFVATPTWPFGMTAWCPLGRFCADVARRPRLGQHKNIAEVPYVLQFSERVLLDFSSNPRTIRQTAIAL